MVELTSPYSSPFKTLNWVWNGLGGDQDTAQPESRAGLQAGGRRVGKLCSIIQEGVGAAMGQQQKMMKRTPGQQQTPAEVRE